jgi:ABC-type polysaccharide/polyol phosphate export permease
MENNTHQTNDFTPYEPQIRHKEIDLIQSVITRMADNQFKVKGFCITILGFFIVLFTKNNTIFLECVLASIIAIYGCYKLDLNFLKIEKLYRMWYDFLLTKRHRTAQYIYELNPRRIKSILNDQNPQAVDFDPKNIEKQTKTSWSFNFYLFLILIIVIFYLPTCFAALSTHCPILSLITL